MTQVLSEYGANVTDAGIKTISQQARAMFRIEIYNRNQLKQILRRLQKIKGVEKRFPSKRLYFLHRRIPVHQFR